MYYDLFAQGPGVYVPVLIVSFIITIAAYCAFPLIFSSIRKKQITSKKYRVTCFLVNFLVMTVFIAIGGNSSGFPYFLWTSIFYSIGIKRLRTRNVLVSPDALNVSDNAKVNESVAQKSETFFSEPTIDKQTKSRYCKLCGGTIDRSSKQCTSCGKQYFNIRLFKPAIMISAIVLAIAIIGLSFYQCGQYQQKIETLNTRIAELETAQASQEQTIDQLQNQIATKDARIRLQNQEKERLADEISELESEISFYDRYVVFVNDDGTQMYHKYDCMIFQGSDTSFWAYNIDAAISEGFHACFYCSR